MTNSFRYNTPLYKKGEEDDLWFQSVQRNTRETLCPKSKWEYDSNISRNTSLKEESKKGRTPTGPDIEDRRRTSVLYRESCCISYSFDPFVVVIDN